MVIKYTKYPNYITDEPVVLRSFNGGINTDPSDSNLLDTELKDAVNFTYKNNILEKREGAQRVRRFVNHTDMRHQGVFSFATKSGTWFVIANNGNLWYANSLDSAVNFRALEVRVDEYVALSETIANPHNLITGLERRTTLPTGMHTGFVHVEGTGKGRLIFQNTRPVEGASIDYRLYIATGTRFLMVEEVNDVTLKVEIVKPKVTLGQEQKMIGFNYLSPFPEYLVQDMKDAALTSISNIYNPAVQTVAGTNTFRTVMTYGQGKSAGDYRFKWEVSKDDGRTWSQLTQYRDQKPGVSSQPPTGKGVDTIAIAGMTAGLKYRIRCSFAAAFKQSLNQDDKKFYYVEEPNGIDWVVDNVDGEWFGQAVTEVTCVARAEVLPANQNFLNIHSCVKILADGNKLILYDDINLSGNWYKTVIGQYDYITDRGSLNFQTNKNEQIVKVVNFQGVLVVFSNNKNLGGNIAVVSGNGDDVAADQSFSPYQRKVVNTTVTADNANSVQMSDNYLIFKNKDNVYMMDNSALNAEILEVVSVNDRVRNVNEDVSAPWEDDYYYSEITSEYYALIWPTSKQRWKMFYRYPTRIGDDQKVFFPWLRDTSPSFDILGVITFNGLSTHLTAGGYLVQYNAKDYKDEGEHVYPIKLTLKPCELRLPSMLKFIQALDVTYYREQTAPSEITFSLRNEAGHHLQVNEPKTSVVLHKTQYEAEVLEPTSTLEHETLRADSTGLHDKMRLDTTNTETRTLVPRYGFPCVAAEFSLEVTTPQRFSFAGIAFHYLSTDIADSSVFDIYHKIILPREMKGGDPW